MEPGRDEAGRRRGLRLHVRDHADESVTLNHTDRTQHPQDQEPEDLNRSQETAAAGANGSGAERGGGVPAERVRGAEAPGVIEDAYSADKIKVLEGLEAVRKRPAMYIGSTGPAGLHHLVYEIVDNSIDEALAGLFDQINLAVSNDGSGTVVDNGRGNPGGKHTSREIPAEGGPT